MYGASTTSSGSSTESDRIITRLDHRRRMDAGTSAAAAATAAVASGAAAVAAAAAAAAQPHDPNESLYDALLRYHQEHDSTSTESSQLQQQQHQQQYHGQHPPHLERHFSCTGDDDDRKVPALPTPELNSRKTKMVDPTTQRDAIAISPLTAPSFLSISEDGNDIIMPTENTTTTSMKKNPPPPPPPPPTQQNQPHPHDDTAAMHSSFYLAALEEANLREGGAMLKPPGGDHSAKNDNIGVAVHVDDSQSQQPRTAVVSSAAAGRPPSQRDEILHKPYSPKAKKPGIVMVNEPAIRSNSPMYQAAYGNQDGRDSANRTRPSISSIDATGGGTSGSTSGRSTASTDSLFEDAAEAAAATMTGSQPPSRNTSIDRSVVVNVPQDQQPVPPPWPLTSTTSSGSYEYNDRQDQPNRRNFPPFPKTRGEYQPPKRQHSQPHNPTDSIPTQRHANPHVGARLESRNSYTPGMNTNHSGMVAQNTGYVGDISGYGEYTSTLPDDVHNKHKRSGSGNSFTSNVPSKPPPPSSIGGAVRHHHHHHHPRNPSPTRHPPTPSPMVPKQPGHPNAIRRMSSGSSGPPPDLMEVGSDKHIRSSIDKKSSHRQSSGGGSRRSSSSRSSSPARGVVSSTITSPQSKGVPRSTASSIPKNAAGFNGISVSLRNLSPQASPTTAQRHRQAHLSSAAVTTSLIASAPWNDPSAPSYVSTSQRNLHQETIQGRAEDGHFDPTKHVIDRPIVRNRSNPDLAPSGRSKIQQTELRRTNSSSLGSLSLSGETSQGSKDEMHQSVDSATTDADPDLKLALELSLREAAAASSNPGSGNTDWNTTSRKPLYPHADLPVREPDHHVPPSLSSRYPASTQNSGMLDATGSVSRPNDAMPSPSSTRIARQNAPYTQHPAPRSYSPAGHSRTDRDRSPLPPHSRVSRPLNDNGRVVVGSGTSSQFVQDVYRPAEATSRTELDEDLMLALKLSAEEAASNQHRSEGIGVGMGSSFNSPSTGAASSAPDEQYKILKRIQEEQERKQLEEALKASKQDSKVVSRGTVIIGNESKRSQGGEGSNGRRPSANVIESTGGSGALTPHPVEDQRSLDYIMSQRLAMEGLRQQQQQQPSAAGQVSTGQSSSGVPVDPKRDHLIERGTRETHAAIAAGQAQYVTCQGCGGRLHAPVSYSLVFCPRCSTITPY